MMRSQHHLRFTRGNMITSSEVMQSIKREKELRSFGVFIFTRKSGLVASLISVSSNSKKHFS